MGSQAWDPAPGRKHTRWRARARAREGRPLPRALRRDLVVDTLGNGRGLDTESALAERRGSAPRLPNELGGKAEAQPSRGSLGASGALRRSCQRLAAMPAPGPPRVRRLAARCGASRHPAGPGGASQPLPAPPDAQRRTPDAWRRPSTAPTPGNAPRSLAAHRCASRSSVHLNPVAH